MRTDRNKRAIPGYDKILSEGMREGDLADLVLPLISVDEFVSKVDPSECIVFGFYVHDEDAAKDLNRFLQKSGAPLMDTDISPAPDQHGYFMVFIEMLENDRMAENVKNILAEIKTLVDIEEWQMQVRLFNKLIPFSEENLKNCLEKIKKKTKTNDVLEFLRPSMLNNARIDEGNVLIIEGSGERHVFRINQFDRVKEILESHGLAEAPITFDMRTVAKMNRIRRALGEGWEAVALGQSILLHNHEDPRGILLEKN